MKTKIKDGDTVDLKVPVRVDGYVYCPEYARRGSWDRAFMLPGARGRAVRARTPCVTEGPGPEFFANVDIEYMGEVIRVRPFHHDVRRVRV